MIKKDMYFKHNEKSYKGKWFVYYQVMKKDKEKDHYICNVIEIQPNNIVRFSIGISHHKCVLTKEISKAEYDQERERALELIGTTNG